METALHSEPAKWKAILGLTGVNLLWGFSFPATIMANQLVARGHGVSSGALAGGDAAVFYIASASFSIAARFSAALVLLALLLPRRLLATTRVQWRMGALVGLAFASGLMLQLIGLNQIPASRSGFLTSLTVVFTPIAAGLMARRRPPAPLAFAVVAALFGVSILTGLCQLDSTGLRLPPNALDNINWGDGATTLAAMIFAGQIILIDRFGKSIPSANLTPGMFASTIVVAAVAFAATQARADAPPIARWASLAASPGYAAVTLGLALFCSVVAFHWMNKLQPQVSSTEASVVYTLEPLFATSAALFLPGLLSPLLGLDYANESLGTPLLVGGGFVFLANLLVMWPVRKPILTTSGQSQK